MRRLKSSLSRPVLRLARADAAGTLIARALTHMSSFLPIERLYETELVIAFYHPRPSYRVHILIVPKRPVKSFGDLSEQHLPLVWHAVAVSQQLVRRLGLAESGYRFLVNGGSYQDVQQLHFHLVSGDRTS